MLNTNKLKKTLIGILSAQVLCFFIIILLLGINHNEFIYNLEHIFINGCLIYWLIYIKEGTFIYKYITNNYYLLIILIITQIINVFLTALSIWLCYKDGSIDILCLGVLSWSETLFNYIIDSVNCMDESSNISQIYQKRDNQV